jgi:5,10-methylenetetrahydromethanopterin reductase
VTLCRAFVRGGRAEYEGKLLQSNWNRPHIPVLLAGDGPKTLELAGEAADGAIVGSGLTAEVVRWGLENVRRGLQRAGRKPGEVSLWVDGICTIADTTREAREIARRRIHIRINHNFRYGFNAVPPERLAECQRYRHEYSEDDVGPGSHNAALITDYMIDRFAIAGTPDECLERFRALKALDIAGFISATPFGQQTRRTFIRRLGKEILPHLR